MATKKHRFPLCGRKLGLLAVMGISSAALGQDLTPSTPSIRRAEPIESLETDVGEGPQDNLLQPIKPEVSEDTSIIVDPAPEAQVEVDTQEPPEAPQGPIKPENTLLSGYDPNKPVEPIIGSAKRFTFSVDTQSLYDDNIFLNARERVDDLIFVVSPAVKMQLGDSMVKEESYLTLNYNPQAVFFVDNSAETALDHSADVDVQYALSRLSLGFQGKVQRLSGATPDLGDREERTTGTAKIRGSYGWGARTEIETSLVYSTTAYDNNRLSDWNEVISETFLRYQITGKTKAALGLALGQLSVDGFDSQQFERALAEVACELSGKVTLKARGGVEFRDTEGGTYTTPILALGADYKATERTTLSFEAFRDVSASGGLPGTNILRTGLALRAQYAVGERTTAALSGGYEHLDYQDAGREEATKSSSGERTDDYFFLRPSVSYELKQGKRFEMYYLYRQNDSSQQDFSFDGNQVGLSFGMEF